jgi:hypothetical protein
MMPDVFDGFENHIAAVWAALPIDRNRDGGGAAMISILPQGSPPELTAAIARAVRNALVRHGPSAFASTREAALAHEAGHAIVGTHEGLRVRAVTIFSQEVPCFGMAWGGRCDEASGLWTTGPSTTAEDDLRRARMIVAGLAGEKLCGLDVAGSSLANQRGVHAGAARRQLRPLPHVR